MMVILDIIKLKFDTRDDDFQKFNARAEEMELMRSQYRKMEMRLESYEKTNEQMDDSARLVLLLEFIFCLSRLFTVAIGAKSKHWRLVSPWPTGKTKPLDKHLRKKLQHS